MSRSSRLLSLLQLLQGRRIPITSAAIAHALGISERTVYRDIATLVAQGAPIKGEAGVGYMLGAGYFLPPLMLEAQEAEAILLGLQYVSQRGDEVLCDAVRSTRAKIAAILPETLRIAAFDEPVAMPGPVGSQAQGPITVHFMRTAIRAQCKLAIVYADGLGEHTERVIWPVSVGFMEQARVVGAWCELRQDFRTFRLDRIVSAVECGRYLERRGALLERLHAAMRDS